MGVTNLVRTSTNCRGRGPSEKKVIGGCNVLTRKILCVEWYCGWVNFENYRRVVGEVYDGHIEPCYLLRGNVGSDPGGEVYAEVDKKGWKGSE